MKKLFLSAIAAVLFSNANAQTVHFYVENINDNLTINVDYRIATLIPGQPTIWGEYITTSVVTLTRPLNLDVGTLQSNQKLYVQEFQFNGEALTMCPLAPSPVSDGYYNKCMPSTCYADNTSNGIMIDPVFDVNSQQIIGLSCKSISVNV